MLNVVEAPTITGQQNPHARSIFIITFFVSFTFSVALFLAHFFAKTTLKHCRLRSVPNGGHQFDIIHVAMPLWVAAKKEETLAFYDAFEYLLE